jgi:hypothetical protein
MIYYGMQGRIRNEETVELEAIIARIIGRSSSAARGPSVSGSAVASAAAGGGGVSEARTTPITPFVGGAMTKATFRSRMERAGRPLKPGQDVCHIIAEANGGANHSDNFFIAGEAFNRSTGNRHDQLIAYIAGREAAERAVAISRSMNGYSGPTRRPSTGRARRSSALSAQRTAAVMSKVIVPSSFPTETLLNSLE